MSIHTETMNNTLYNRLNEVADQQAAEGNSWRSFVGQHNQDAKGERVYEKQLYKIRESILIDIGEYSDHDFHPLLEKYDTTKVRRLTKDEVKTEINRGSGEIFEWYVGVEEANEIILDIVSNHINGGERICTKPAFVPRYGQLECISEIVNNLRDSGECLFYGHTGIGKTLISLISALQYLSDGGVVLCTTPIVDTIESFISDIENGPRLGTIGQKYSYMTKDTFNIEECLVRKSRGEVVFVIISAQDLFYDDNNKSGTIRDKYAPISHSTDLWIRDERHKLYEGDKTSRKLECINANAVLDLTATPYNIQSMNIVERSLPWAIKNRDNVGEGELKIPLPYIECLNTHFSMVERFSADYDPEEGFDPAKLFDRTKKGNFVYQSEIISINDRMYFDGRSKGKNMLSITNDDICSLSKKVGMWVLPPGRNGDSAESYITDLCKILNAASNDRRIYVPSYAIKGSAKGYINELSKTNKNITIVTCKRFITGTDIPCLGHIALFTKMASPMEFEQLLGRAIRKYRDTDDDTDDIKDDIKLYTLAPSMHIKLAVADIARNNSSLGGSSVTECLECLPLTEYDLEGNSHERSALDIIGEVQSFYRKTIATNINLTSILNDIDQIDLSDYSIKVYGQATDSVQLSDDSEAKATTTSQTPGPKKHLKKVNVAKLIKDLCVELVWVSITMKDSNLNELIDSVPIQHMFSDADNLDVIKHVIYNCQPLEDRIVEFIDAKRMMYDNTDLLDIHDSIFINNDRKKKAALVYTPVSYVKKWVDENADKLYDGCHVVVEHATSGSIPLYIRDNYPNVKITCLEYFSFFTDHLKQLDFNVIQSTDSMKFDVYLANPPYQNGTKNGTGTGSGNSALYLDFVNNAKNIVKPGGIISMITPTSIVSGSSDKTKYLVGKDALYGVSSIDFNTNEHFNIGERVCRWTATNTTDNVITKLSDGREIDLREVPFVVEDYDVAGIVQTLLEAPGPRLDFSNRGGFASKGGSLRTDTQTPQTPYLVDFNGKDKYVSEKCNNYHQPKIFVPQQTNPKHFKFYCAEDKGASQSTYTCPFNTIGEAQAAVDILNNPYYLWIVNNVRIASRLRKTHLDKFPIVDIESVLSEEQKSYIDSNPL